MVQGRILQDIAVQDEDQVGPDGRESRADLRIESRTAPLLQALPVAAQLVAPLHPDGIGMDGIVIGGHRSLPSQPGESLLHGRQEVEIIRSYDQNLGHKCKYTKLSRMTSKTRLQSLKKKLFDFL